MKRLTLSLLAVLFATINVTAQSNFKLGYIVNLEGDTLKGEIDYREWAVNPTQIKFKSAGTTRVIDVVPENAKGFGISGFEYYRSVSTSFSKNPIQVAALSTVVDTVRIAGAAFLKIIASGKNVTLYSFTDDIKQRFFVSEGINGQPEELIYQLYILNGQIKKTSTFVRQLQRLTALYQPNNQKLLQTIQSSSYSLTEIRKIVYAINGVAVPKETFAANGGSLRFFAGIGMQQSTNDADLTAGASDTKNGQNISPSITGGFDLLFNRNIGDLIFRTALTLSTNKLDVSYSTYSNTPFVRYLSANQYTLSIVPQVVYNFYNSNALKIYGAAGPGFSFNQFTNKVNRYENYAGDVLIRSVDETFPQAQNFTFRFNVSAGIVLNKRYDIYAGFSPATRVVTLPGYGISTTTFRVGVNYIFITNTSK